MIDQIRVVSRNDGDLPTRVSRLERAMDQAHLSLAARGVLITLCGFWDGGQRLVPHAWVTDYFRQTRSDHLTQALNDLADSDLVEKINLFSDGEWLGIHYGPHPDHPELLSRRGRG